MLYGCGLRRSELVSLDLADWHTGTGVLTVRADTGAKARIKAWMTYIANGMHQALSAWLAARGTAPGPLFWSADRFGNVMPGRLSDQGLLRIAEKRAREAAVQRFSPHDLRRSMISHLLDAGADISTAQRLAGHASVVRPSAVTAAVSGQSSRQPGCSMFRTSLKRPCICGSEQAVSLKRGAWQRPKPGK